MKFCQFLSGNAPNIIASDARIKGTLRTFAGRGL